MSSARVNPSTSVNSNGKAERSQRWLLWIGIIAPLLFATVFMLNSHLRPGFSAADEAISYLDLGASGWIQRANFILFGLLLSVFLFDYIRCMRPILGQAWLYVAGAFLLLSDLGWIMAGLFVPNPYLAPQAVWPATLHQLSVIVAFLPFAIACFIIGVRSVSTHGWRIYGVYCIIFAFPLLVFPIGTIAYLINQNIVGNVNSPGGGTMDQVAIIAGPLAWYVISAMLGMLRVGQKA
jgi:hypothetical membrane protein